MGPSWPPPTHQRATCETGNVLGCRFFFFLAGPAIGGREAFGAEQGVEGFPQGTEAFIEANRGAFVGQVSEATVSTDKHGYAHRGERRLCGGEREDKSQGNCETDR